jgi:Site-specific recombinase XerD
MDPHAALQLYLDTRTDDVSEQTLQAHRYRLQHFVRWCDSRSVTSLHHLDGQDLHQFRLWRRDDGDLNTVSLHTQLSTLRVFLKFCESVEAVEPGLYDKLLVPSLDDGQDRRDNVLEPDHADAALDYLSEYEYASADHVMLLLLWRTGMRVGALRSLDVADYDRTERRLSVRHRPEGGTPLKLGMGGERLVTLSAATCMVVNDYLADRRPDATDDSGRQPLIVFGTMRPSTSTFRTHVHRCTQPCLWQGSCPFDGKNMDDCASIGYGDPTSDCPESVPPHDVRRGAITHWLSQDVPKQVVSDRMNVDEQALDKHYDQRSKEVRAEQRREYLNQL